MEVWRQAKRANEDMNTQWREAMERDVEHGKPGHSAVQRDFGPEGSQTPEDDEKRVHESTACEEAA